MSAAKIFAALRAQPELKTVPFMHIPSTLLGEVERLNALATGADRFSLRPIDDAPLPVEIEACLAPRMEF